MQTKLGNTVAPKNLGEVQALIAQARQILEAQGQ